MNQKNNVKKNNKKPKINSDNIVDINETKKLEFNELSVQEQYNFLKITPKLNHIKYLLKLNKNQREALKKYRKELNIQLNQKNKHFNKQNLFEIRNFNLWYNNGKKQALYDLNVDIKKGQVTSLIGPSGCGKSTFLKNLNRMNDLIQGIVYTGDIWFNGINIKSRKIKDVQLRSEVGMVFQKPTPFEMSIYDNVAFGPKAHGIRDKDVLDKIVQEALEGAALWDEVKNDLHSSGTSLSGGQQQRLCIARAIALKPKVLLMDEPTSALDPIATAKIEDLILNLSSEMTIIIVTHSMAQAQRVSDNTIFFYKGKIIEAGLTKNIFTKPQMKQTKDYINGKIA